MKSYNCAEAHSLLLSACKYIIKHISSTWCF